MSTLAANSIAVLTANHAGVVVHLGFPLFPTTCWEPTVFVGTEKKAVSRRSTLFSGYATQDARAR
jgi:hypothetical protein